MIKVHPQYIIDQKGQKTSVIIPVKEFEALNEELDDWDDIKLYDQAKKKDNGKRLLFSDYLINRKKKK